MYTVLKIGPIMYEYVVQKFDILHFPDIQLYVNQSNKWGIFTNFQGNLYRIKF